jgi:hypothetical protein
MAKIERLICGNGDGMFEDKKGVYVTYDDHKKMVNGLLSELLYSAYSYNRDCGMTHKQLLSIGLGNNYMKLAYEQFKKEVKKINKDLDSLSLNG